MKNKLSIGLSIFIIIIFSLLTINSALGAVNLTDLNANTELYYSFDNADLNGSNPLDLTPNNHDGTNNGATTGATGKLNEVFDYDGTNDYVEFSVKQYSVTDNFSMFAWIKLDVTGAGIIIQNTEDRGDTYLEFDVDSSTKLRITYEGDTTTTPQTITSSTTLTTGTWYHVGIVHDASGNDTLYINGSADGSATITSSGKLSTTGVWSIGARKYQDGGGGIDSFLNGKIDEAVIFDKAINQTDIDFLYASGSPTSDEQYVFSGGTPPASAEGNFTIFAQGTDGEGNLINFNATIVNNGTYNTTGNYIVTKILSNSSLTWNITITKNGYASSTYNNWNVSKNLTANLTALPLEDFTIITPINDNTKLPTYSINWTKANSPAGFTVTYNVSILYTNNTEIESFTTTNLNYTWNNTLYTIGNYTVKINATEQYSGDTHTQENNIIISPQQNYFILNIYDYFGTSLLTNTRTNETIANVSKTSNPFQQDIYSYLNETAYQHNNTANITIEDLEFKHRPYNNTFYLDRWTTEYNINMTPNQLVFWFYQDGSLHSTEGVIHHSSITNGTYGFEQTNITIIQQSLALGYVKAKFGMINGTNWTQYYEYINDYETHVNENIEILQKADWTAYIKVLDKSNNPLKDVTIRANYAYTEIGNWTPFNLLGQRLTNDEGLTFFWGDKDTELILTITKDGYEPAQTLLTIGDNDYTINNPITFNLLKSDNGVLNNAWIYVNRDFTNESLDLSGTITALGRERVQVQTAYREGLGLIYKDITNDCDGLDNCPFTLVSGTDYDLSLASDITLYVYLDNVLWRTLTIEYDNSNKNKIFNFTGLNSNYLNPLLIILILMITLIMGLSFKNTNIGIGTFYGTSLLAGMISSSFLWLTLIITFYYTFKVIRKVISE